MFKITVITGSRAEYGLLSGLMRLIDLEKKFNLQLIVTGAHLSKEMGKTIDFIKKDGFKINHLVDMKLKSDQPIGISESMSNAMQGFGEAYRELEPDLIILLGDRYEAFVAASVATIFRIPIAHLHGGERTEGAFDEAFRHSLTKMSHLHFTSLEEYSNRVIQMGENPINVFNVGAIGIDNIKNMNLLELSQLEERLGFKFTQKNILLTYHPVTLENQTAESQFKELLGALDASKDISVIFTKSNADVGARRIDDLIDDYVRVNRDRAIAFGSMGQLLYLSTMQYVDAVIGNSSSGIIEAPSFKIGTINIGDRQKGRYQSKSIINCSPDKESIADAISKLYSEAFQSQLKQAENPYGKGDTANRIKEILVDVMSNKGIDLKKEFYDIR